MTIKSEYLELIRSGAKSLEIRVGYPNILSIKNGNEILFISGCNRQIVAVRDVRRYDTFDQMLTREDFRKVVPGLSKTEVLMVLQEIYPPEKESLGVVVMEVCPIKFAESDA